MGERLQGKRVVITGASRGLGLGISTVFADEGASVVMLARNEVELEAAAAEVAGSHFVVCDVANPVSVRAAFTEVNAKFGGIDVLINNAALALPQRVEDADDAKALLEVSVNLLGPLYCMREAIASMRKRGGGDIINVSSESVVNHYPFLSLYAATKSALETLSAGIRTELTGSNIRVSVYRSGRVLSSFNRDWDPHTMAQIKEMALSSGFEDASGGRISPEIPGKAMLDLVLLDRSARVDFLQLRGM